MTGAKKLGRESRFSYKCNRCSQCCYYKRIQVNPYEVARISINLKLTTTDVIDQYLERGKPYLKTKSDGSCVFLTKQGCGVHADRPLVCRLYPLAQIVSGDDRETFIQIKKLHPMSKGIFGQEGTVDEFLRSQETLQYLDARDKYRRLLFRMLDVLSGEIEENSEAYNTTQEAFFNHGKTQIIFLEWFDIDKTLKNLYGQSATDQYRDIDKRIELHIKAMEKWITEHTKGEHNEIIKTVR